MSDWSSFWLGWLVGCSLLNFVKAAEHQRAIRENNRLIREAHANGGPVGRNPQENPRSEE